MIAAAGAAYGYEMGCVFWAMGDYLMVSVQLVAIVLQKLCADGSPNLFCSDHFCLEGYSNCAELQAEWNRSVVAHHSPDAVWWMPRKAYIILSELGIDWIVLMSCFVSSVVNKLLLAQIAYSSNSKTSRRIVDIMHAACGRAACFVSY
uniref:Uncharacterized protein n=1 Tax=Ditylenchus dipsaci TaxID=166011 RepID=A0A915EEG1_9BILA